MKQAPAPSESKQTELARKIHHLSVEQWGEERATVIIGVDGTLEEAQKRLFQFAQAESPVLITGETGTGKELFARALYLLSSRRKQPLLSVNCAQYTDGQLLLSELFGHRKGSFTGAVSDHRGVFEEANHGIVFLDEVSELSASAQAMLLRTLSEGEVLPVGETHARQVSVRTIAATSRDLKPLIAAGQFREDLFYRLRFVQLRVPPLRARGRDWELTMEYYLEGLNSRAGITKSFCRTSLDILATYHWPGNVRELKGIVETGFHMSEGPLIRPAHFSGELAHSLGETGAPDDRYVRMVEGGESFWDVVYHPFMDREVNRSQVREIITRGLATTWGSYKGLLAIFHMASTDYLKFMDFLRHHRLKPL